MNYRDHALELASIATSSLGGALDSVTREGLASDFERWLREHEREYDWEDCEW